MSRAPAENATDPAETGARPGEPDGTTAPSGSGARRALLIVAAVASLTLSLLTLKDVTAGHVVDALTVVGVTVAFLLGMWDALEAERRRLPRRTKVLYAVAIPALVTCLVIIGTVSRGEPQLPRLSGTRNIAVIGFAAPAGSEQELFDDVATTVTEQLRSSTGTDVHDCTSEITPPWKELRTGGSDELTEADDWALDFVQRTGAKLLLGGYGQRNGRGQVSVHIAMYLAPGTFQDVPELGGWYPLSTVVLDRALDRNRAREELHHRLNALVHGTTTFLRAVDTLQTGRPDEAITMLNELMDAPRPSGTQTLYELVALFRGHTHQELAVRGLDRDAALTRARDDYLTVDQGSQIAVRARLSLAGNDYLQAVRDGCAQPAPASREQLSRAAQTLREIATGPRPARGGPSQGQGRLRPGRAVPRARRRAGRRAGDRGVPRRYRRGPGAARGGRRRPQAAPGFRAVGRRDASRRRRRSRRGGRTDRARAPA